MKMHNPYLDFFQLAQAALDANVVIAMRMMRLASGGALAQREAQRMIVEKGISFAQAQMAFATKLMTGEGTAGASKAAGAVYRRKLRSNRRRLSR
jgi:hypothetical protein